MKASNIGKRGREKDEVKKESKSRAIRDTLNTRRQEAKPADDHWKEAREPRLKPFSFDGWGFQMPKLDVAEKRAQLHDDGAAYFEKCAQEDIAGGNAEGAARLADLAKKERELAAWWRKLADFPEAEAKPHYEKCEMDARDAIDALLARAEKFDEMGPDKPLWRLQFILWDILWGLEALAAHGSKQAITVWLFALSQSVGKFETLAFTKPELFREGARQSFGIPGTISRNKEKQADNQRLLKLLEQGEDYHLAILPKGTRGRFWQFQDRAEALAVRLQSYIEEARASYSLHVSQAQHFGWNFPAWRHKAMKLEPFSAKTWRTWAKTAWEVLAEISPAGKPEDNDAFYKSETQICDVRLQRWDKHSKKQVGAPSVAKQHIRDVLFGAFEQIATGTSQRTKRRQKAPPKKQQKSSPDN